MTFREYSDKSSIRKKNSRLLQGGETEKIGNKFLGWWERRDLGRDANEKSFVINHVYAGNPDLIAFDYYGNVSLGWIVLQYNNIVDVNTELVSGAEIMLPSPDYVSYNILINPLASRRAKR